MSTPITLFEAMCFQLEHEFHEDVTGILEDFKNTPLQDSHIKETLGEHIRKSFRLWQRPWEPVMKNGIDISPDHPETVSAKVIETVHWKLNHPH